MMRSLQYYFYEFKSPNQAIVYDFGTDRVAAFTKHRELERQGKKLSAVQIKRPEVGKAA